MLGEAGATVYCTGRSTRDHPPAAGTYAGRPETIDETAAMVTTRGGAGIAVRVDHLVPEQVEALFARVRAEQGAARRARQRHLGGRDSRLETVLGAAKDQPSTSCRPFIGGIPLIAPRHRNVPLMLKSTKKFSDFVDQNGSTALFALMTPAP